MPLASIIVPVWNCVEYVKECLSSVKRQTLLDFECIVVDDGSTDSSVEVISKEIENDCRFKLLRQKHQGLSAARNAGIAEASSDIVFHLDADDMAFPEMMEKSVDFLISNDLDMAFFDSSVIDGGAKPIFLESERRYFKRKKNYGIGKGKDILKEMIDEGDYVYAVFIQAARKSRIKKPFYIGLRAQDKLYTTQNLLLMDKVGHLSEILHVKRCHPKCITHSKHDVHYAWSRLKSGMELVKTMEEEGIENEEGMDIAIKEISSVAEVLRTLDRKELESINMLPLQEKALIKAFERILTLHRMK